MKKRQHLGTLRARDLLRDLPVGHDEGRGRQPQVHRDRRWKRPKDRLRRELRGEVDREYE